MASECSAQRESLPPFTRVDDVIRICLLALKQFQSIYHCVFVLVAVHYPLCRLIYTSLQSPWDLSNLTRLRSTIAPVRDTQSVDQQLLCTNSVAAAWVDLYQATCLLKCRVSSVFAARDLCLIGKLPVSALLPRLVNRFVQPSLRPVPSMPSALSSFAQCNFLLLR